MALGAPRRASLGSRGFARGADAAAAAMLVFLLGAFIWPGCGLQDPPLIVWRLVRSLGLYGVQLANDVSNYKCSHKNVLNWIERNRWKG